MWTALLISYLVKAGVVFGIGNILALIGLFYSVHETAIAIATTETTRYVDEHLKAPLAEVQNDISKANDYIQTLYTNYGQLLERKVNLDREFADMDKSLEGLKTATPEAIKSFGRAFAELEGNKTDLASAVGKLIDKAENLEKDQPQLVERLSQLGLHFFASSGISPFIENLGDIAPSGVQQDEVKAMTDIGLIVDCKLRGLKIPDNARGVILKVAIGRKGGDKSAGFVPADDKGNFPKEFNDSIGFSNYTGNLVGGIVFCPFFDGQKFKYKLCSNGKNNDMPVADPSVGCIAFFVGYF